MLLEILLLLLTFFMWIYYVVTKQFNYFKDRGVPYAKPSFPFGSSNSKKLVMQTMAFNEEVSDLAEKEMKNEKIFGYFSFGQPIWVINDDEELAKRIFIKDFDHFSNIRKFSANNPRTKHAKVISRMFFNMEGEEWRKSRSIASGAFSSGRLKQMTANMVFCGQQMEAHLKENVAKGNLVVDSKELSNSYAMDAFYRAGFGLESNSFVNKDSQFRRMALSFIGHPDHSSGMFFRVLITLLLPDLAGILDVNLSSNEVIKYFVKVVEDTYRHRKATGEKRNDLIGVMVEEMDEAEKRGEFIADKEVDLVANTLLLFLAGYDTVSAAFTIFTHHMLDNPDIQDKIYAEILDVLQLEDESDHDKPLTYDQISSLQYLDKCINESFRLQEFISHNERLCTKDYKIPGTDYVIEKGRYVKCYVRNFAKNPNNFVNPNEFDPENFAKENNPNKFGVHMFGHGPRSCPGMRYGILSLKVCIIHLMKRYKMVYSSETVNKVVMSLEQVFGMDGIKFQLESRM